VTLTLSGGSGVKVTIGADGKVMADFSGMQPATFSTQLGTTPVTGEITYQGTTDGTVDLTGTASPSPTGSSPSGSAGLPATATATPSSSPTSGGSGKSGPWNPTGTVNVSSLQVTVKVTQPIASTLINGLKVSDVTGAQTSQTGNAIDLQPLLRPGTYQCQSEKTLVITTSGSGPVLTWTLSRS
jgi:hypothetical protein